MAAVTIDQAFHIALQHHQAGRLQQAEILYRQILDREPRHTDALHLLGVIACQAGRNDLAVDVIRQAIALKPDFPEALCNLGLALTAQGQWDEAVAACRQAIALKGDYAEAHSNLGVALEHKGQLDEAAAAYRQAIALKPNWADAHYNLGHALRANEHVDEAVAAYRQAIALKADYPEAHGNLANALKDAGRLDEAAAARAAMAQVTIERALQAGLRHHQAGQLPQAEAFYRHILAREPNHAEALHQLGVIAHQVGADGMAKADRPAAGRSPPEWAAADLAPPTCKMSYVITTRNDGYCGDPMGRLERTLGQILSVASDFEVIVADWSSPVPVAEVMKSRLPASGKIRFLYLPPGVTGRQQASFSEIIGVNAAIRRSRGVFAGRLDQDTLIGPRFASWVAHDLRENDTRAYFSGRRELPPHVQTIQEDALEWQPMDTYCYFASAVGILMAPRSLWHRTRGYDQTMCFQNYQEYDLCFRFAALAGLENLGVLLKGDFYHQWHQRAVGVKFNPYRPLEALRLQAERQDCANDGNWGLGEFQEHLVETVW